MVAVVRERDIGHLVFQEAGHRIYLTSLTPQQTAELLKRWIPHDSSVVISMETICNEIVDVQFLPISLEDIARFYETLSKTINRASYIVICTGPVPRIQFGAVYLLGCYMLISGSDLAEVRSALHPFDGLVSLFECNGMSCHDFWSAFHQAQREKWVTFGECAPDGAAIIEIEEYKHYCR